jgi:hypothetical protein
MFQHVKLVSIFVLAGAGMMGCGGGKPEQPTVAPAAFAKADQDLQVAAQGLDDAPFAQREAFVARMRLQLDRLNADLDGLSHQVEQARGTAQAEAAARLAALRTQSLEVEQRLQGSSASDASGWNDFKSGIRTGYGELTQGITTTRQWLSDQIAP